MNICFFVGDYMRSGGTERSAIAVANGLADDEQIQVWLLATNTPDQKPFFSVDPRVKIIHLGVDDIKKGFFSLLVKIPRALKANKIQRLVAVEVMSLLFLLPMLFFKRLWNIKTELWVWEHFNFTVNLGKKVRDWCRRMAAKHADVIVVLTEQDVNLWKENLEIKSKILAISNPSPFTTYGNEYKLASKKILAIGRLTYQKGFDRLVEIWGNYKQKYSDFDGWSLQIIGSGPDQDMLMDKAKHLGIAQNVEFIANTPNIQGYYEDGAFLAMTSRFEGLPMTLIEAQSFGLPIIAYDCLTGPSEVLNEKSGILVPDGDKKEFVESLHILMSDSALRQRMSDQAKIDVSRFENTSIVNKWKILLNDGKV